ncbi:MAG: hypothetical protein Q4A05_02235 [Ruminococcus sp.]|nr:hypothetical protein [Ruminococcus sp.]
MDEMKNTEVGNAPKNGRKSHKVLIILGCLVAPTAIILVGLLIYIYGLNMAWGSRMIDDRDAVASECGKAIYAQVRDCCEAQGRSVPDDKEYIVRATCGKDGLVNEPCELLPESVTNKYYSGRKSTTYYIAVRFRDGVPAEAWSLEKKPLTDDMLRSYSREEQREMFGRIKGARDVIGYRSFKDIVWENK